MRGIWIRREATVFANGASPNLSLFALQKVSCPKLCMAVGFWSVLGFGEFRVSSWFLNAAPPILDNSAGMLGAMGDVMEVIYRTWQARGAVLVDV